MTSSPAPIDLIGVPFNSGGTSDGVARSPRALRAAGLVRAIGDAAGAVHDSGDVALDAGEAVRDARSGVIAPRALATMIRTVRGAVAASLDGGGFPLVIGGDCPVLIGCLAAVSYAQTGAGPASGGSSPGVLFVDGHEDAWPALASTTGEAADMELGWLLGIGVEDLPGELRRDIPVLDPDAVTIVGARDRGELAASGIPSLDDRIVTIRPAELERDGPTIVDQEIRRLADRGPWWLHVDLDVLSTASLAAVDYPQPGGLEWASLDAIVRRALGAPHVVGWDVTIYNPDLDPSQAGARRIVEFLAAACGSRHAAAGAGSSA